MHGKLNTPGIFIEIDPDKNQRFMTAYVLLMHV